MEDAGRVGRVSGPGTGALFHPCVVLLLDEDGRQVGRHVAALLACLPPAVRAWVELMDVSAAAEHVEPDAPAALDTDLAAALARVTTVHQREGVRQAGYAVGEAIPLVLLVGHTTAPTLLPAARVAQRVLARDFPRALRMALLCDTRPTDQTLSAVLDDQARKQDWDALVGWSGLQGASAQEPPIALCLVYQDYDERNWYWNAATSDSGQPAAGVAPVLAPEDVQYAVAEAVFALAAAGLTGEAQFRERLRLTMPTVPGGGGEAARRFATLATARLAFPRAQAEVACGSYEGAHLLDAWIRDAARYEQSRAGRTGNTSASPAVRFVRSLRDAIEDSDEPLYRRAGVASPPLSADGVCQLYGFDRVQADPARIFATFGRREIGRERSATRAGLADVLSVLDERARVRYGRWREAVAEVWEKDRAQRARAIIERVDEDLCEGPSGLARTRAYLRELRQGLILMRERQEDGERFRAAAFARYLRTLSREVAGVDDLTPRARPTAMLAPDVARAPAGASAPQEPDDLDAATSRMSASAAAPTPATVPAAADGPEPASAEAPTVLTAMPSPSGEEPAGQLDAATYPPALPRDPTDMPERLLTLIGALTRALAAHENLVASGATVLAALIMLLPFLVYTAVGLAPLLPWPLPVLRIGAGQVPVNVVLMSLILAVLVAVPPALLYRQRIERARQLRRLLVGLYTRWWAEVCGREEDALRRTQIESLSRAVDERLAAVADFEDRLRAAAARLRALAETADRELETGPASRRDVFVVAGRRFPALRLDGLYEILRVRRAADPREAMHATDAALGTALRERLRAGTPPLLQCGVDELATQAAAFGMDVCRPYLTGDLVTVTPVLHLGARVEEEAERVALGTLFERATPLFRSLATDSPRRAQALAAPSDIALVEGVDQAAGISHVVTPSGEWLIAAQLVSDGRPRWWRRSIIERADYASTRSRRATAAARDESAPAAAAQVRMPVSTDTV